MTMDCKVEADVMLLSVKSNLSARLSLHVDAHSLRINKTEDVRSALMDVINSILKHHQGGTNGVDDNTTPDRKKRIHNNIHRCVQY